MSSIDTIASGYRGNKRAACDRCRQYKARCPRREAEDGSPDSGKCARCVKAGAVCNFSTSIRSGRPNSKYLSKQGKSFDANHASRVDSSNVTAPWGVLTEESRGYNATFEDTDLESFLNLDHSRIGVSLEEATELASWDTTLAGNASHTAKSLESCSLDFFNLTGPSNPTMPGADNGLKSIINDPYPMDLERYAPNNNWGLDNPVYSSTCKTIQGQDTSVGENSTPTLLTPLEVRMVEASRMATEQRRKSRQPNSDDGVGATGGFGHLQASSRASTAYDPITPRSASSVTPDRSQESLPTALSPSTTQDIQYRRIQELSELGLSFHSQIKDYTSQGEANPLALDQPNNIAVKVLESSLKFQNLLISLYPLRPTPSSITNDHSCSTDEDIPSGSPKSQGRQQQRKRSSLPNTGNNSDNESGPQPVDMTEVFALLTCYIRLLHLHFLYYSRLSDFLTSLFQKGVYLPPLFPSWQAGSVSLDSFAKFQVKLLIQVSTHTLGEIEIALGLPDGYRISKKDRHGIFKGMVSVQFIEMMMREEGKSGLGTEDKFTSIRDHLGRLGRILKGAIEP